MQTISLRLLIFDGELHHPTAPSPGFRRYQPIARRVFRAAAAVYFGSMIRIGSIVIRVDDLQRQLDFWTAALDYVPRRPPEDDFVVLGPRDGPGPNVSLDRVPAKVQVPPRIHLDLYSEQQTRDVDRLLRLGASRIEWSKRPADADYVILADPEGNRFCVVDTARP
jgi:catechol 2,3-dioxygenase-like lactoylglutathione lyase family enzyme